MIKLYAKDIMDDEIVEVSVFITVTSSPLTIYKDIYNDMYEVISNNVTDAFNSAYVEVDKDDFVEDGYLRDEVIEDAANDILANISRIVSKKAIKFRENSSDEINDMIMKISRNDGNYEAEIEHGVNGPLDEKYITRMENSIISAILFKCSAFIRGEKYESYFKENEAKKLFGATK